MTKASPAVICLAGADPTLSPRCQAMLQCAEACCDPVPCARPASARVTFPCSTPGCQCAYRVLLLCTVCAEQVEDAEPGITRRPL
jgi:hypothetical protein